MLLLCSLHLLLVEFIFTMWEYILFKPAEWRVEARSRGRRWAGLPQGSYPRRDQEQGGGAGLERERELDFFCFSCFPAAELRTLSLWLCSAKLLGQHLRGAVVAAQCRTDTALTFCCSSSGPRQPCSSGLAPVPRFHSSVPLFPLVPVPNRPTRLRGR